MGLWPHAQAFHDAGWTRREVFNVANALSMARLLSGPLVAHLIMQHHWPAALTTLAIAGSAENSGTSLLVRHLLLAWLYARQVHLDSGPY